MKQKNILYILVLMLVGLLFSETANSQKVVFSEDFEGATTYTYTAPDISLDGLPGWTYDKDVDGQLRFDIVNHTGSFAALLDASGDAVDSYNYLTLTTDLSDYSLGDDLVLSFYMLDAGDEDNNDAIYIRGSNADSWIELLAIDPTLYNDLEWNLFENIDITTALSLNAQNYSSTFQIMFVQFDNYPYNTDGIAFDDIQIQEINPSVYVEDIIHKDYSTCNISFDDYELIITNSTGNNYANFVIDLDVTHPNGTTVNYTKNYPGTLNAGTSGSVYFNDIVDMTDLGNYSVMGSATIIGVENYSKTKVFNIGPAYASPWKEVFSGQEDRYWDFGDNFMWDGDIYQYASLEDTLLSPSIIIDKADYYLTYKIDRTNFTINDTVIIQVSQACTGNFTNIDTIVNGSNNPGKYNNYSNEFTVGYPLNAYQGSNLQVRFIKNFATGSTLVLEEIYVRPGNDMAVTDILISDHPYCGTTLYPLKVVVQNVGPKTQSNVKVDLEIYGRASANLSGTLTNAIQFGDFDTLAIGTFDATLSGTYELIANSVTANDDNTDNDTYSSAFYIEPAVELPVILVEDFDEFDWGPTTSGPGFTFGASDITSDFIQEDEMASFVSFKVGPIIEKSYFAFDYKIVAYDASMNLVKELGTDDIIKVEISEGCGGNFTEVYYIDNSRYIEEGDFQTIPSIDLSAYIGKEIVFKVIAENGDQVDETLKYKLIIDNVHIGPADVAINNLDYSTIDAWCGNSQAYLTVTVDNNSNVDAFDIPVFFELSSELDLDIKSEGQITSIAANSSETFVFGPYDITQEGLYHASAYCTYLNDYDNTNNRLDDVEFEVFAWQNTPYVEDFLDTPSDWDLTNGFNYFPGNWLNAEGSIYTQLVEGDNKSAVSNVIGPIQTGDFLAFNFSAKAYAIPIDYSTYLGEYIRSGDTINVYVSDDCATTWVKVYSIHNGNYSNPSAEYTFISNVDLSAFDGETIRVKFEGIKTNPVGFIDFTIDDFHVISTGDAGVMAVKFPQYTSNVAICGAVSDEVMVIVHNYGKGSVANVPVVVNQIFATDTIAEFSAVIPSIEPNSEDTVYISGFNTVQSGSYEFYAYTALVDDLDDTNDELANTMLTVQSLATLPDLNSGSTVPSDWRYYHDDSEAAWASDGTYIKTPVLTEGDSAFMTTQKMGVIQTDFMLRINYLIESYDNEGDLVGNYLRAGDQVKVQVSDDCGETFTTIHTIDNGNHMSSDEDTELVLDLTTYAGSEIAVRLWVDKGEIGQLVVFYESINVTIPTDNITLVQVYTEDEVCGKLNEPVYAVVKNSSINETISSFDLTAIVSVDNVVFKTLTKAYTGSILPGDSDTIMIGAFDAQMPDQYDVDVSVELVGDIDVTDNSVATYSFTIFDVQKGYYANDFDTDANMWKFKDNFSYSGTLLTSASLSPNDTALMYSPRIGKIGANNFVQFDLNVAAGEFAIGDKLELFVSNDCGSSYTLLKSIENSTNLNTFSGGLQTISIASYEGDELILKFVASNQNGANFTLEIDNFMLTYTDIAVLGIVNETHNFDINTFDPSDGANNFAERYITCGTLTDSIYVVIENKGFYPVSSVDVVVNVEGKETTTLSNSYSNVLEPGVRGWVYVGTVDSETTGLLDMEAIVTTALDDVQTNDTLGFSATTQEVYPIPFNAFASGNFNEAKYWKYDKDGNMNGLTATGLDKNQEAYAITPRLHVVDKAFIYFNYSVSNSLNEGHIIHDEVMEILVRANCGDVLDEVWMMDVTTTDFASSGILALDLGPYAGQDIQVVFRARKGNSDGLFTASFSNVTVKDYGPLNATLRVNGDLVSNTGSIVCEGDNVTLSNAIAYVPGITGYTWEFVGADTSFVVKELSTNPSVSFNAEVYHSGTYTITAWTSSVAVMYTEDITFTVDLLPTLPIITGHTEVVTNVGTTEYYATAENADNYHWEISNGEAGSIVGTETATAYWTDGFVGNVDITVVPSNACADGPKAKLPVFIEYLDPEVSTTGRGTKSGTVGDHGEFTITTYPNPNDGFFTIELPEGTKDCILKVQNNLGFEVLERNINSNSIDIDIRHLNSGLYHLIFIKDGEVYPYSIIKR